MSRRVKRAQFAQDDIPGPAVHGDVMRRQQQVMHIAGELDDLGAKQRAVFKVEGRVRVLRAQGHQPRLAFAFGELAQVGQRQLGSTAALTALRPHEQGLAIAGEKTAQRLMAIHELGQRRLKRRHVERAGEMQAHREVVGARSIFSTHHGRRENFALRLDGWDGFFECHAACSILLQLPGARSLKDKAARETSSKVPSLTITSFGAAWLMKCSGLVVRP